MLVFKALYGISSSSVFELKMKNPLFRGQDLLHFCSNSFSETHIFSWVW